MFRISKFLKLGCARQFSSTSVNVLEHLPHRTLIRVSGNEASQLLQGLITNDMQHLDSGPSSMYSMVLNTKGRVLCDTIIYRTDEENTFLLECDKEIAQTLQKHIKMYKVRRKISIDNLENSHKIYVAYDPNISIDSKNPLDPSIKSKETQSNAPEHKIAKVLKDLFVFRDPRLAILGSRIISTSQSDIKKEISDVITIDSTPEPPQNYRKFRYSLGVGEGVVDLPPGECFPLEANCDYLHGVSFHKGCYIGQELTARTHHTGVIRKRLMPVIFTTVPTKLPDENKILVDKTNMGKIRGVEQDVGLALLRIAQAVEIENIPIGNGVGHTLKPNWWPIEAPKEKMTVQKP